MLQKQRKRVYDEIHGFIELNNVELEIIDTPSFQRLRRIKQLSVAYLVYPAATHTRFSHSLGTMYLMGRISTHLYRLGYIDDQGDIEILRIAALLHDIGHPPYSHTIEAYYTKKNVSHEELTSYLLLNDPYIPSILEKHGVDPKEITSLIRGRHKNPLYNYLLSSDLDVDRMDYLRRDSAHTGVAYGLIDIDRLIDTMIVDKENNIAILDKGLQSVESFYIARLHMYQAVYYHKTITAYELLLEEIYSRLVEEVDELRPYSDPSYIRELIDNGEYAYWDDNWLHSHIVRCAKSPGDNCDKKTSELAKRYLFRKGPKLVLDLSSFTDNPYLEEQYSRKLEEVLEELKSTSRNYYVIVNPIMIIDEESLRIYKSGTSIPITDRRVNSIIGYLPKYYIVARLYTL